MYLSGVRLLLYSFRFLLRILFPGIGLLSMCRKRVSLIVLRCLKAMHKLEGKRYPLRVQEELMAVDLSEQIQKVRMHIRQRW
jgi:hypothetical protein